MDNYFLFLDDERIPSDVTWIELPLVEWTIVRNYDQFVNIITQKNLPSHISFDHDLADEHYFQSIMSNINNLENFDYNNIKEKTGYECAKWLVDYCIENKYDIPPYTVHSMSIIGKQNIIAYLEGFKLWKHKQK